MSLPCESPHQTLPSIFLHKVRERIQKESGPPLLNKKVLKFFSLKKKKSRLDHTSILMNISSATKKC